jgi:predicted nucleic acid-binding protein
MVLITADTNILVYQLDLRDPTKFQAAGELVDALRTTNSPLGLQLCGEFYRAATRRFGLAPWTAAQVARNLMTAFPVFAASVATTSRALAAAATGLFAFWDANLLAAAEEAGCTHILSEDMADGARLGRIEVVTPFGPGGISDRARALLLLDPI